MSGSGCQSILSLPDKASEEVPLLPVDNIPKRLYKNNLNRAERFAIRELQKRGLIIQNVDNGSCMVVKDRST